MRDDAIFEDNFDGDLLVALAGLRGRGELVTKDTGDELGHQAAPFLTLRDMSSRCFLRSM